MKMNSQSRTFVKQVQVDLLALSDADLFQLIHQWVDARIASDEPLEISEDTRLALGYSRVMTEAEYAPGEGASVQWRAPTPEQLRTFIAAMDVNMFAKHVITLAFQALHPIYPEWYEGLTFNAHLANYLRRMRQGAANA